MKSAISFTKFIVILGSPIYIIPQPYEYETTSNNFVADGYVI